MFQPSFRECGFAAKKFHTISTDTHIGDLVILLGRAHENVALPMHLGALLDLLRTPDETRAAARAGDVFVAMREEAVAPLTTMLSGSPPAVSRRTATLLGRIASTTPVTLTQDCTTWSRLGS